MEISKIVSIVHFNTTETDGEFIFQQLYYRFVNQNEGNKLKNKKIEKL
ncbi:hypothetical protein LEP1GSC173_4225 [Leptospira interrogans str. HAI1594]|uniref:Uncharacterized protein n=1 Tax=Leptospira interrogans serovar Hardjo str. Norma TaxID=1279460 RepID=A0A0M4NH68_LEPIR|nr:hypothetical protein G436_0715 [Leptospira interrogans serovar Hardjo str. Norma]EKP74419.1 hypothetical protein LEP1GSC173_4225 [Leptospira interrogans str. HAI1594]